jgi:hypothetical protein
MLSGLALVLVAAVAVQDPVPDPAKPLTLELRVFNGTEEVTAQTRTTLHRPDDHGEPLLQGNAVNGRVQLQVPAGIYDVQAIHERDGRVLNIRWANRLVVMMYPDEGGHHLEVINFKNGYGALQIRDASGGKPDVLIYESGRRDKPAATPVVTSNYLLFILRAGVYDLLSRRAGKSTWYVSVDVPLDRTRLWVPPDTREELVFQPEGGRQVHRARK